MFAAASDLGLSALAPLKNGDPNKHPSESRITLPNTTLRRPRRPAKVLVIDLGGSNVKMLATGQPEARKAPSGKKMTPHMLVAVVQEMTAGWEYEAIAFGFPGVVDVNGPINEPVNLGKGWVGFDFSAAFGKPVKLINDAAMQALGSYEGGRMLFLGLGTGLGSTLISDRVILPLELGVLPYKGGSIADFVKKEARKEIGDREWEQAVGDIVGFLRHAFVADYVMLGGGNVKRLTVIPPGARLGDNENAFVGGFRLWNQGLPRKKTLGIPRLKRPQWKGKWRVV